ncbi:hypothetical protein FNV43_RR18026 [Rhamnella rubrinervis]|uniref:Pectinesterase n=1 Tax=Rhamnella rubrinervis TaxID=2594499 RepID=A0A8K0E2W4_9ROSA|nr:hypothetical protein FNV43_RR18026 [Rhamnella rubrinervis]
MSLSAMDISYQKNVKDQCRFARYPTLCVKTLMGSRSGHKLHIDMIYTLLNKTISETKLPVYDLPMFVSQFGVQHAQRAQSVTEYCEALMSMSSKRLRQSLEALIESPRKNKQDIQTWLSAALTFQEACKDSATGLGLPGDLMTQISQKMSYVSQLTSNPLAFVNRITGKPKNNNNKNTSTRRLAEDDHDHDGDEKQHGIFPKWVSPRDRKLLQATTTTIKANAVVAKDGSGNYKTVSEAFQAASGGRFVIYVKKGVYQEKIHTKKDGITLIGDGKYETIIVGDDSVASGSSMPGSATFTVTGDGFIARDIGFQNTAGPEGKQALALNIASDHSVVYRCSVIGYQDTLYAVALRQFYRECDIYGTIDFIFGNAAAVFQNCFLGLRRPRGDSYNVILANGRSDPGQNTGFSLQNCRITVSSDFSPVKHSYSSYLGRPWKEYSRSVVMESTIDDAIAPRGWIEWPGNGKSSLETLYFAEYANMGPGAGTSKRVTWPGFHVIGTGEAVKFTVGNFIAGTSWLPSTGVTFISGLQ